MLIIERRRKKLKLIFNLLWTTAAVLCFLEETLSVFANEGFHIYQWPIATSLCSMLNRIIYKWLLVLIAIIDITGFALSFSLTLQPLFIASMSV